MLVTIPVQVEIPDGYEFVRYGVPWVGDLYVLCGNVYERSTASKRTTGNREENYQ